MASNISSNIPRGVITPITRSRTLAKVAVYALGVGLYSVIAVFNDIDPIHDIATLPGEIHAALTLVIGWLLVFRTNTAYARWWEARTLWGALVNASRNLIEKTTVLVNLPHEMQAEILRNTIAFPFALRDHLRSEAKLGQVPGYEKTQDDPDHVPNFHCHFPCCFD